MRLIALAAFLLLLGCAEDGTGVQGSDLARTPRDQTQGRFAYTGYAQSGKEVVRGTLTIAVDDSNVVSGTWDLVLTDTAASLIGPQVGYGTLVGDVRGEGIGMNLNPTMVDNNVVLMGRIAVGITGTWQYVGFPGVLNQGTFVAVHAD